VPRDAWQRFSFIEGDIRSFDTCQRVTAKVDFVLHEAAVGSVPDSLKDPIAAHDTNVVGFVNILLAARDQDVTRLVYASSSAVYGNNDRTKQIERATGEPLSPYAATKQVNEIYASAFHNAYGLGAIGLRYFNVFGPRQSASSASTAVIPAWFKAMLRGEPAFVNGDGATTRDFCHVGDIIQANLLAATKTSCSDRVFNIGLGRETNLNELFQLVRHSLATASGLTESSIQPTYRDFRVGDIHRSTADIARAVSQLGYGPVFSLAAGLTETARWYYDNTVDRSRT
jgi:UDP-N-acetylglucosamine 4-epimerase